MGSTHEANLCTAALRVFASIVSEPSLQVDGGKTGASRFGQGVKESTGPAPASLIRAPMPDRVDESSSLSALELMDACVLYWVKKIDENDTAHFRRFSPAFWLVVVRRMHRRLAERVVSTATPTIQRHEEQE